MKKKFSRILGVSLTITLLISLMVVATPIPVSADPGNLVYDTVATPSAVGGVLQAGSEVSFLVVAPDGTTMFAFSDNATAGNMLYKSTDAGVTWAAAETAATANLTGKTLVGLAVSPNYATDSTIVAATTTAVWFSSDGGATFVAGPSWTGGGTINSIDIGRYYATGVLNMLIGLTGNSVSNVQRFPLTGAWSWVPVGAMTDTVLAVRLSPAHTSDAQILAVSTDGTNTYLNYQFGTTVWNVNTPKATVKAAAVATGAVLAFGSDYIGTGGSQTILVGTQGAASPNNDVYRVTQTYGVTASNATRLYVTGTVAVPVDNNIKSIAVSGAIATAKVLVGLTNSNVVYRTSSPAASTITWTESTKSPTGGATSSTTVLWVGDAAYAGTTGFDSALSKSTDSGANWNQLALIDVGTITTMSLVDVEAVDTSTIFLIMKNTNASYAARSLFKTINGGISWERVSTGTALAIVKASPKYATDSTVYVASTGSNLLQKSTDGGATFTTVGAPAAVTALTVVDGTNYFTGAVAAVYRSGYWGAGTITAGNVVSIALSPKYATDSTLLVGTDKGTVYQSTTNAANFTQVAPTGVTTGPGGATDAMYVAYDADGNIYAGASVNTTASISRWVLATATVPAAWLKINANAAVSGLVVTSDGALYAADNNANIGIWRSLTPTGTTLAKCEFQAMNNTTATTFLLPTSAQMADLSVVGSGNATVLYGIASGVTAPTTYGYTGRVVGITDTLNAKPDVTAPAPAMSAELATSVTDNESGVTKATVTWTALAAAKGYAIEVCKLSDFAKVTTLPDGSTTTTTTATGTVTGLTGGTIYYYRVRATTPVYSQYSQFFRSFITALPALTAPAITTLSPAYMAIDVSVTPIITWPAITGAANYEFELSTDELFNTVVYSTPCLTNSCVLREPLAYSTTYYWRVKGISATAEGAWTASQFTTIAEPEPAVGQYVCPIDGLRFNTQAELEAHNAAAHPAAVAPAPVYTCPQCGLTYGTQAALSAHWNAVHAPPEEAPAIPNYLLWTIIGIGAVLIIALIVLIVRTRRVA